MNFKFIKYILVSMVLTSFIFTSCKSKEAPCVCPKPIEHSILLYVVANNNLSSFLSGNVNEVIKNYSDELYNGSNVAIYYKTHSEARLLKISNNTKAEVVITYDKHNAATPEVMSTVIADFKRLFPANSYGMLLSGHGSGWLPKGFMGSARSLHSPQQFSSSVVSEANNIQNHPLYNLIRQPFQEPVTRAFGDDGGRYIDSYEIAQSMKDDEFEYIIFDACYMSSIELAYDFRNKANWMLGAPTEILGAGLNYNTMMNHLFNKSNSYEKRLTGIATDFTEKYNESTVSLIDLGEVDAFAQEYKKLMATIPNKTKNCTDRNIQTYDRFNNNHVIFDLVAYTRMVAGEEAAADISTHINKVVKYKFATSEFLNIPIVDFSGISIYIPFDWYTRVTPKYKNTDWYKDIIH